MNSIKIKGFTLIELLIVIAILGTLAVVVLLALNPVQQLARTRDSGRTSAITQLGHALEAYATSRNGVYVAEGATWVTALVTAGEIATVPAAIDYTAGGSACTTNAENNLCYDATTAAGGAPAIIFARMEAQANNSRCTTPAVAWFVYSTNAGRGGIVCSQNAPTVGGSWSFLP